jgi:hypothetical protein
MLTAYQLQRPAWASDLRCVGRLLLDHGRCCGKQVVSEQWIAESTAAQVGPVDRLFFFDLHWWLGRSLIDRCDIRRIAVRALGGQKLPV